MYLVVVILFGLVSGCSLLASCWSALRKAHLLHFHGRLFCQCFAFQSKSPKVFLTVGNWDTKWAIHETNIQTLLSSWLSLVPFGVKRVEQQNYLGDLLAIGSRGTYSKEGALASSWCLGWVICLGDGTVIWWLEGEVPFLCRHFLVPLMPWFP